MAQEGVLHVGSQGTAAALAAAMSPGVLRVRPQLQVAFRRGHRQGKSFWSKKTQIHHPLRCYHGRDLPGALPIRAAPQQEGELKGFPRCH